MPGSNPFARRRREEGQSAVEIAMILPVLLILVVGVMEMGQAWRVYQITTTVARDGARLAMLPGTLEDDVRSTVLSRVQASGLDPDRATILFNDGQGLCDDVDCTGEPESVKVQYPFEFPFLDNVAGIICGGCGESFGSVTITSETVMRNE